MSHSFDIVEVGARVGLVYVPLLFSLCFHEYAHGWVAKRRGDLTAQMMGRLSMNPMVHADTIGTFILPIAMLIFGGPIFGWAKPVPVNEFNLKKPKYDMFWIALAGPMSNIILGFIGTIIMVLMDTHFNGLSFSRAALSFFAVFIQLNLFLAVFNLIPLHPLDGGKILARFLPDELNQKLEAHQSASSLILLALFMTGALSMLFKPIMGLAVLMEYTVRLIIH